MIWHCAEWALDCTVSDGCFWVLSLEWDNAEGDAESYSIWEPLCWDEGQRIIEARSAQDPGQDRHTPDGWGGLLP